jgi:hypothetical protein
MTARQRDAGPSGAASERSAAGELAILPDPGDALSRQAPASIGVRRDEPLIAQRPQFQGRSHIAMPPADGVVDRRDVHADARVCARQVPERTEHMDEVATAHSPIVAPPTGARDSTRIDASAGAA